MQSRFRATIANWPRIRSATCENRVMNLDACCEDSMSETSHRVSRDPIATQVSAFRNLLITVVAQVLRRPTSRGTQNGAKPRLSLCPSTTRSPFNSLRSNSRKNLFILDENSTIHASSDPVNALSTAAKHPIIVVLRRLSSRKGTPSPLTLPLDYASPGVLLITHDDVKNSAQRDALAPDGVRSSPQHVAESAPWYGQPKDTGQERIGDYCFMADTKETARAGKAALDWHAGGPPKRAMRPGGSPAPT